MSTELDVFVDLNSMDDTGLPWGLEADAPHPERLRPGAYVIAGSGSVRAVAQVVDVACGVVHVRPLRGPVASHAHLLTAPRPAS
jgi:hypothetical protein